MAVEVAREAVARAVGWRGRLRREGGDGGGGDGEGGGGEGGSQASCSMLLTGVHPPLLPPHRTTQRWLPSAQMTLTVEPQPQAVSYHAIIRPKSCTIKMSFSVFSGPVSVNSSHFRQNSATFPRSQ